jgi:uncharacterized protein YidB (DUF937 family)
MTALLGLLAVAGYQNRDKLAEMLGGAGQNNRQDQGRTGSLAQDNRQGGAGGLGGLLGGSGGKGLGGLESLFGGLAGGGLGGLLGGGLRDLVENFKQAGQGDTVDSWVARGPNKQISPQHLEQAIGPDTLATLSRETGLSHEELLARLSRELPDAIDKYTPDGRVPSETEFARS